jgi:hypothetical protein
MYLYVRVSTLPPSTIVMFDGHVFVCWSIDFASFYNCDVWRSRICMLEYRLCLLLQLWCLTVMYLYVRVSTLPPSTIVMFDGHVFVCWSIVFDSLYNCDIWRSCICMLEYRLCLLLQLWCLTVMYLYDRVSTLSPSTIVMIDSHVFVCLSIVFDSLYNCDIWRSCICMLEYRLCLLPQLWCLTVMYLYVGVSSLSSSTIVMFDSYVFVC